MAEEKKEEPKKKKIDPLFLGALIFSIINLLGLVAGLFVIYQNTLGYIPPLILEEELRKASQALERSPSSEKKGSTNSEFPVFDELMIQLDPFTANLDGQPQRVIQIKINLKVLDEKTYDEVLDPLRLPKIRDAIIKLIQKTHFDQIESLQGKLFFKDQIIGSINPLLDQGVVRDVYFSELVVQ